MYSLIKELDDSKKAHDQVTENINQIFSDHASVLIESAERYLGQAIAALNSGQNPFDSENPSVDPQVAGALTLLSDPANREAFNFTPAKFAVLDHVDKSEKVRRFLVHKVASSASGRHATERLTQVAAENPKAAARMLTKAQMAFKSPDVSADDTEGLDVPSKGILARSRQEAGDAAERQGRLSNVA